MTGNMAKHSVLPTTKTSTRKKVTLKLFGPSTAVQQELPIDKMGSCTTQQDSMDGNNINSTGERYIL